MGNSCRRSVQNSPSSRDSSIHGDEASVLTNPPSHSSMNHRIGQLGAADEADLIISFIEHRLNEINAQEEASSSSTSEIVSYSTRMAVEGASFATNKVPAIINRISGLKDTQKEARKVLKAIGESHWVFMGLSVVAYVLERKSNVSECKEVLEKILDLIKVVRTIYEIMPGDCERVCRGAVNLAVEGAIFCYSHMSASNFIRKVRPPLKQLKQLSQKIQEARNDLILSMQNTSAFRIQAQSPFNSSAEGTELQEAKVKELLDMEGGEPAVAVTLCGLPGVGKSTLAASVVKQLRRTSTDFNVCMITIDENTPDKTAHIVKLQSDILYDFTGQKMVLRNAEEGRKLLQEAIENQSCFLFIDNVADIDYIRKLLPRRLSTAQQSEEKALLRKKLKQRPKLRILVTSRKSNLRDALNIKKYKEYAVKPLSSDAAKIVLWNIILQDESKVHEDFDEARLIDAVAEACKGVPILLTQFGNHLRLEREKRRYEAVLEALAQENLLSTASGHEDVLFETLLLVYNAMRETAPETHEAFLDICTYFEGQEWDFVGYIVGREHLEALHRRMLVTRSDSDTVIVEDIFRAVGLKEAKGTRITNYEELSDALNDKSKLDTIKGLALLSDKSLITLESEYLNAMHNSLRVLHLGDLVTVDGPPCAKPFINLRYLRIGDAVEFPFKDASKLDNLKLFLNASKAGMDCGQLLPSVKLIHYQVPDDMDGNAFARLQLENMKSLEWFRVKTQIQVELPRESELPASLKFLNLSSCKHVPKFSELSALEHLALDHCDIKSFPPELGDLSKLKHLSVNHCKNLVSLSEAFGKLSQLEELNLRECEKFRELPPVLSGLSSLQSIDLTGCIRLQRLPDSFGRLPIRSITLQSLVNLEMLPQSIGNLPYLKTLNLISCNSLTSLPDSFVQLERLEKLRIESCIRLGALPTDFGQLSSLKEMIVEDCPSLKELPCEFQSLPALKMLSLIRCNSLVRLPEKFGELICLEELHLKELFISRLPHGFAKLKALSISEGYRLETLPDVFENLESLKLKFCRKLEATTMDIIGQLRHCFLLDIEESTKLVERWKEMQRDRRYYPMVVIASTTLDEKEWQRAARDCLFHGECRKVNESGHDLIYQSSLLVDSGTTLAVIRLPNRVGARRKYLLQRLVAAQREKMTAPGQLQIICVENTDLGRQSSEEMLSWLPEGSYAIPSTDVRRFALIQYLYFHVFGYSVEDEIGCMVVEVQPDDQGNQCFRSPKVMGEKEISEEFLGQLSTSQRSEERNKISEDIGKWIKSI